MPKIDWEMLHKEAENGPNKDFINTVDITVAERLAFGFYMNPYEVVVVKDTVGRIWLIFETTGSEDGLRGLVSRYNVRPGMQLRLKILRGETKVFCITPEE